MDTSAALPAAPPEVETELERAVRALAPRLLRFARGRYGAPGAALAEEAAQEALAALVGRWRRHGAPDSPEAFAYAVLRRRLARARVRAALSQPLETLRGRVERDDRPAPDHVADTRSELQATRAALAALAPKLREALLLVAVSGLTSRDAADVLGISASALKMRVSRARIQLREQLHHRRGEQEP